MEWIVPLAWAIFGALLSVSLSYYLPIGLNWLRFRNRPDLLGRWSSAYQGIDEPPGTWVTENVFVDTYRGQLRLRNADSSHCYVYTALGKLVQKVHLVGDWESIRPGATAYGAFVLTVTSQAECMYGYWVGPDHTGARRYGRWVLTRDQDGVDKAKRVLEEMRQSGVSATIP